MDALAASAAVIDYDLFIPITSVEIGSELGSDNHLISNTTLLHPFSNPLFRLLTLIIVACINEVTTLLIIEVQDTLSGLLIAGAHCDLDLADDFLMYREQMRGN